MPMKLGITWSSMWEHEAGRLLLRAGARFPAENVEGAGQLRDRLSYVLDQNDIRLVLQRPSHRQRDHPFRLRAETASRTRAWRPTPPRPTSHHSPHPPPRHLAHDLSRVSRARCRRSRRNRTRSGRTRIVRVSYLGARPPHGAAHHLRAAPSATPPACSKARAAPFWPAARTRDSVDPRPDSSNSRRPDDSFCRTGWSRRAPAKTCSPCAIGTPAAGPDRRRRALIARS